MKPTGLTFTGMSRKLMVLDFILPVSFQRKRIRMHLKGDDSKPRHVPEEAGQLSMRNHHQVTGSNILFLTRGLLPSEDTAAWNCREEVDYRRATPAICNKSPDSNCFSLGLFVSQNLKFLIPNLKL